MGKLHVCKSTVVDEKSGNSALFFQCLSFQSYHVIHQQELNTLKHLREHTVKNTAKLRRTMIFFYAVSLKYKTQAHSYRNQMFLGLKHMLAKKNIFSSKVWPQNNQYEVLSKLLLFNRRLIFVSLEAF